MSHAYQAHNSFTDAIEAARNDGTVNPQDIMIHPDTAWETDFVPQPTSLEERLKRAIENQNLTLLILLMGEEKADPMRLLTNGLCALDYAIQCNWSEAMWCFVWSFDDLAVVGLRALLTAINMGRTNVVELVLNMGMRRRLSQNETMKLLVYGWTCKHGTVEMLDILDIHGPWFNWGAYVNWCWLLTSQTGSMLNGNRVLYFAKFYRRRARELNPLNIPTPFDQYRNMLPRLANLFWEICIHNPECWIDDYYEYELRLPDYDYPIDFDLNIFCCSNITCLHSASVHFRPVTED